MRTNEQTIIALLHAGYSDVRLWGSASTLRWAAIKPYAGGFGIISGDPVYLHNETWWFPTLKLACMSVEAWENGRGSPPPASRVGPRCITRKGKLKKWSEHE